MRERYLRELIWALTLSFLAIVLALLSGLSKGWLSFNNPAIVAQASSLTARSPLAGATAASTTPTTTPEPTPIQSPPTITPTPTSTASGTPVCGLAWRVVDTPDPATFAQLFNDVVALSTDAIWAVGYYENDDGIEHSLTAHWNGSDWTRIPCLDVGAESNVLFAVTAVSETDIWAVGTYHNSPPYIAERTLTLHWDGTQWREVPSPNASQGDNWLFGVVAISANDVWAVGRYELSSGIRQTLTMHWDGTQWSIVPSPNVGSGYNQLVRVDAISSNDVWAVGYASVTGINQSLTMHWDGTAWSVVPSPNPGIAQPLRDVVAVSSDDIWAVGVYQDSNSINRTLAIHWNGDAWSIVPTPDTGNTYTDLWGISAASANDIWAVGYTNIGVAPYRTHALHWDGSGWSIVSTPSYQQMDSKLLSVAAISSDDVWSVGVYWPRSTPPYLRTVAQHYSDPCVTPTPSPTPTVTVTPCPMSFTDVFPTDYFYEAVRYLYCAGVISGYSDNTFRPFNTTTRGQLTKIVVLAFGLPIYTPPTPTFTDVPTTHSFYPYIETAAHEGLVSGYADGTFRPQNDVTRGQLSKIVVEAAGWPLLNPPTPTFLDVAPGSTFYQYAETAYDRGIISGYSDGTFRPGNNATRGQICKIVYNAITAP